MTPAINQAKKAGVHYQIHSYEHDSTANSYGLEAAEALGIAPEQVFKTLVVALDADSKQLAVAVVPVSESLNLKALGQVLQVKKLSMAAPKAAERATGYVVGGISPLGQKRPLPLVIDASARQFASIYVSAGRRGLEIELAAEDLAQLTQGQFAPITRGS